jgi:hypothetical protein
MFTDNARRPADMAGNLVAPVAIADHALLGDLCAAVRIIRRRGTSAHADVSTLLFAYFSLSYKRHENPFSPYIEDIIQKGH